MCATQSPMGGMSTVLLIQILRLVSHVGLNTQILKPCTLATTLNPKLLLTMQNHWIKCICHKRFNSVVYSTGNIYTDLKKVKLGLSCSILMAKKEEERPQIFTSPFFWQTYTQACTWIHNPVCWRCMKAVCWMDSLTSHMQISFPHAALWLACCY